MQNPLRRLAFGLILLLVAGTLLYQGAKIAWFALVPAQPLSQVSLVVEVHKGQAPVEIARMLEKAGAVSDAHRFVVLGRIFREWKKIKTGEYKVSPGMSPLQVFSVITSGISMAHPLTVREGENMYEIAADFEAKGLGPKEVVLKLCRDKKFMASLGFSDPFPPSLEGYLFPDTYFFNRTMSLEDMIRQMYRRFNAAWTQDLQARAAQLGMTRHQAVTLASIIEKETGAPEERPVISSVFHNRLKKKMRLQSDPTTIYGMWEHYDGNIHKRDLLVHTPYNTYTVPALPIGPIGNPGKEAIHAALYPAQSEYLFFVSHNDGTHEFTRSLKDHEAAVRKYQLDPKAREGKSWRDRLRKPSQSQPQAQRGAN